MDLVIDVSNSIVKNFDDFFPVWGLEKICLIDYFEDSSCMFVRLWVKYVYLLCFTVVLQQHVMSFEREVFSV